MSTFLKIAEEEISNTIKYSKCYKCGCQQGTIKALEKNIESFPVDEKGPLKSLIEKAKATFLPVEYDCLGCKVCYPSLITNAIAANYPSITIEDDGCSLEAFDNSERESWPQLAGNYEVFNPEAPVAICTLNSKQLIQEFKKTKNTSINIVGTLSTENLGIERMIKNIVNNPNIRFLILCGEDTQQKIGHLPGQTFLSFFKNGVDSNNRIIEAKGKRPVLKNLDLATLKQFLEQVQVIDLVGNSNIEEIIHKSKECGLASPGIFKGNQVTMKTVTKILARPPGPLVLDPKGYFVIYPDERTKQITVEHYKNDGSLNQIITGDDVSSIYMTIINMDLISRLDHACYLGKELTRAHETIRTGIVYLQDKAQEPFEEQKETTVSELSSCKSKGCC